MPSPDPPPLPENPIPSGGSSEAEVTYRRPLKDTAGTGCGIVLGLVFTVSTVLIASFNTEETRQKRLLIGLVGGGLSLAFTIALIYQMRLWAYLSLRAAGKTVQVETALGTTTMPDEELEALTFRCAATYDDGLAILAGVVGFVAAGGTVVAAATAGALAGGQEVKGNLHAVTLIVEGAGGRRLRFECDYRGPLADVTAVRDEIARRIALDWWRRFSVHGRIEWCDGVEFTSTGLSWTAGWRRRAGTVRYRDVRTLTFDATTLHLHEATGQPPILSIRLDKRNAYPGIVLLNRIREARDAS